MRTLGADNNPRNRSHRSFGTRSREILENGYWHRGRGPIRFLRDDIQDQLALEGIVIRHPTPSSKDPSLISRFPLPD